MLLAGSPSKTTTDISGLNKSGILQPCRFFRLGTLKHSLVIASDIFNLLILILSAMAIDNSNAVHVFLAASAFNFNQWYCIDI